MPKYLVTERQVIHYTWEVEAADPIAACDSSVDGVPDEATSKPFSSDVWAKEVQA